MTERARYWQRWLSRWEVSGLTQTEFCRRHGLKPANFTWWKGKLASKVGSTRWRRRSASSAKFVEVGLPAQRACGYEVVLLGGRVVRLPDAFDAQTVSRLIVAVESAGTQAAVESAC